MALEMQRESAVAPVLCAICLLLMISSEVIGAPILGPDLNNCMPVIPPRRTEADAVQCCFVDCPVKTFKFPDRLPKRVRRPAHKLDEEFINKYKRAYEIARSLPDEDPRSWKAQSDLHCAYCAGAYSQFNSTELLDVHHGWLLLPFHRWFMYFHERILGSLIGDETFAIPYWAWDVQNETDPVANAMPAIYVDKTSSLYDELRCHVHQPPYQADLELQYTPYNREPDDLRINNYFSMWKAMIGDVKTPETFYGGKFSAGDKVAARAGLFETGPHAAVHSWTGDETAVFGEDMAPAYAAARDPIFFAHHSQVDRLWLMWKEMGGQDFDDPDWLDSEFVFYDENSDLVRVRLRDSLNWSKFNIEYEPIVADWLDFTPVSIRANNPKLAKKGPVARLWRNVMKILAGEKSLSRMLEMELMQKQNILKGRDVLIMEIARPSASAKHLKLTSTGASVVEEVLVMEGVATKPFDMELLINVFIDLPEADQSTRLNCAESLGSFCIEPVGKKDEHIVHHSFSKKYCIGDRLRLLNIEASSSVTITFVPMWKEMHDNDCIVEFTNLGIEVQKVR